MAINGIDITYRQVSEGASNGGIANRSNSKTSTFTKFNTGNSNKLPGFSSPTIGFKMSGALKAGAVGIAISQTINLVNKISQPFIQIYGAKTGETMKVHNIRSTLQAINNPIGILKKSLWDNGYIRNLELARENQALQNERDLSGKIILQKQYQKSLL